MRRMAPQLKPGSSARLDLNLNFKYSFKVIIYIKNSLISLNKHRRHFGEE